MTKPGTRYTEDAALAHHGIPAENGLDYVRHEALVLSVCLGCASITVAPNEITRRVMREVIDWDAADCCPDADRIVY